MTFWVLIIALAAAVTGLLSIALLRHRGVARERADFDIAVYRQQLASVEEDLARGVITEDMAERTRVEVSRRILDADRQRGTERSGEAPRWLNAVMTAGVVIVVLGGSLWLYRMYGAPGYGDLPLKDRLATSAEMRENRPRQIEAEAQAEGFRPEMQQQPSADYLALVERLRATVADRPDDARGLALLARNEAALGNFKVAYQTQERLIEVLGADADAGYYSDLADMMVLAAGGYVSPEAEAVLGQALARDPRDGPARYYVGLMQAQNGRADLAFEIWRDLLESSPPDAPWTPAIRAQIEEVAARAGRRYQLPPATSGLRGPDAGDIAASQDMSPEDREAMIRGMVSNLSDRLATQGGTAQEWSRLITALGVLGDTENATAIWVEAQDVFADDATGLAQVNAAAQSAGLSN